MVKPGINQVALMRRAFRKSRMRREAMAPNSPRDSGVGVVMPRAMKPDCVSKSKVRQTIWRGTRHLFGRYDRKAGMGVKEIGIIVNGATGRIGATQHLSNALAPIRGEGGLGIGGDRVMPRLLLVGRDRAALAGLAQAFGAEWTDDLDAALARPEFSILLDAAATRQRIATLTKAIAAGKHIYSEKPVAPSVAEGLALLKAA